MAAPKKDKRPAQPTMGATGTLAERLVGAIRVAFGKNSAMLAGRGRPVSEVTKVVPTGIDVVDNWVLGCGGLPCGRLIELYSDEGGGKSTMMMTAAACAQRLGGVAIIAETEKSLTVTRLRALGVDPDQLVLLEPDTIEDVLRQAEMVITAIPANSPGPVLFAWDSLAATPTKEEVENGIVGDEMASDRAKTLSRACRVLAGLASRHNVCVLVVNQTRTKFGGGWGGEDVTTPGGKAIKFYASVRLRIMGGTAIKDTLGVHIGKDVTVMAVKNKLASPWRKARARLRYATGWDNGWSDLSLAKDMKLLPEGTTAIPKGFAEAKAALAVFYSTRAASVTLDAPDDAEPEDDGPPDDGEE